MSFLDNQFEGMVSYFNLFSHINLKQSQTHKIHYHLLLPTLQQIFTYTIVWMFSDTETDMLEGYPSSAICVQGSDDSRNSAIRIAYRTLLRSSSVWEPRHPSLKIFYLSFYYELGYYQKLLYSKNI